MHTIRASLICFANLSRFTTTPASINGLNFSLLSAGATGSFDTQNKPLIAHAIGNATVRDPVSTSCWGQSAERDCRLLTHRLRARVYARVLL